MNIGFISDESLLGYLLGALDDDECSAVREALMKDRHLRIRLASLQSMSVPLHDELDVCDPPKSMVSRVMSDLALDRVGVPDALSMPLVQTSAIEEKNLVPLCSAETMGSAETSGIGNKFAWLDTGMSLTAAAIGFCLLAPSILQTRETARTSQCGSGLITLGQQIEDYAFQDRYARVPEIPTQGRLAFAGIYAIRLNDKGYLGEKQLLWCPSESSERLTPVGMGARRLPSAEELLAISAAKLRVWQHIAGGSYAYNLGVVINNQHQMPTLKVASNVASNVAILGDAPVRSHENELVFTAHRGLASNVLYQDGRVQLIRFDHGYDGSDHPYLNRNGLTEAGIDSDDSALGISYLSPLGPAR